jgi:hypothetical protein
MWVIVVVALGILAAGVAADASLPVVLGLLAVVVATGATLFRPALGLAVLAFTYPFDLLTYAGPVKLTTSAPLMAILAVVLVGRFLWSDRCHWHSTRLDLPVLAFAGATCLSVLGLGGYWEDQMVGLLKALGGFVIFFLATQALRTRVDTCIVVGAVLATASLQALTITLQVLTGVVLVSEEARATGTVDDPNLFAGYLILIVPLALAVGISLRSWWTAAGTAAVMIALSVALIATLSRGGWIGAVIGIIALAVVFPERRWVTLALSGGMMAIVVLILFAPIAARISPHPLGPAEELSARTDIWMTALSAGLHHPLFGVGVANFVNYYPQYGGTSRGINHAHDIFLNMFAERGVLGVLSFVTVLVLLFRSLAESLRVAKSPLDRAVVAGLVASFAGYLVHAIGEVSYYDYKVLLLFWLLVGVAAATSRIIKLDSIERDFAPLAPPA